MSSMPSTSIGTPCIALHRDTDLVMKFFKMALLKGTQRRDSCFQDGDAWINEVKYRSLASEKATKKLGMSVVAIVAALPRQQR